MTMVGLHQFADNGELAVDEAGVFEVAFETAMAEFGVCLFWFVQVSVLEGFEPLRAIVGELVDHGVLGARENFFKGVFEVAVEGVSAGGLRVGA